MWVAEAVYGGLVRLYGIVVVIVGINWVELVGGVYGIEVGLCGVLLGIYWLYCVIYNPIYPSMTPYTQF